MVNYPCWTLEPVLYSYDWGPRRESDAILGNAVLGLAVLGEPQYVDTMCPDSLPDMPNSLSDMRIEDSL